MLRDDSFFLFKLRVSTRINCLRSLSGPRNARKRKRVRRRRKYEQENKIASLISRSHSSRTAFFVVKRFSGSAWTIPRDFGFQPPRSFEGQLGSPSRNLMSHSIDESLPRGCVFDQIYQSSTRDGNTHRKSNYHRRRKNKEINRVVNGNYWDKIFEDGRELLSRFLIAPG